MNGDHQQPLVCSLNQIEQTVRKAVRGHGLSWGEADEAGKAVRWLHRFSLNGVDCLANLLESYNHTLYREHAPQVEDAVWRSRGNMLSPIFTGLSLSDRVARLAEAQIETGRIAYPLLVTGFLGQTLQPFRLQWNDVILTFFEGRLAVQGRRADVYAKTANRMFCKEANNGTPARAEIYHDSRVPEIYVNESAWKVLQRLAALTYVQASEHSRNRGAGAGLSDND